MEYKKQVEEKLKDIQTKRQNGEDIIGRAFDKNTAKNDVMNDLENGDKINEVAGRYHLKVDTTEALTRSQSFAGLKQSQMVELFNDDSTGKQFTVDGKTVIAVTDRDAAPREMTEQDMDIINRRLNLDISQQAASQLINSYGDKYDVRVKYRQLGLED